MRKCLFDVWDQRIKEYCESNDLDYEKAKRLSKSCNDTFLILQYHDKSKGKAGLLDETPAPIALYMHIIDGEPQFEQTEYTEKYLKKS